MSDKPMNEFRVKVTVRNNLLLSAIEDAGYKSQTEFAEACGVHVTAINDLVGLRVRPIGKLGEFSNTAKLIMEVLGACPSELWTDEQLVMKLTRNTGEREISFSAVQAMIEHRTETMTLPDPMDIAHSDNVSSIVQSLIKNNNVLSPRESAVLTMRFGIGDGLDHRLDEIAEALSITRARVRQIESKALRKLRHPMYSERLRECL